MLVMKRKMNIVAIPEIKNIFLKSQNVSLSKGKSHFLLRDSQIYRKRKHPEKEMKADEDRYKKIENCKQPFCHLKIKLMSIRAYKNIFSTIEKSL